MTKEFEQIVWDARLEEDLDALLRLAVREDVDRLYDWTTVALVPDDALGAAAIVARKPGVVAGLPAAQRALAHFDRRLAWEPLADEGDRVLARQRLAVVRGPARSLLTAERTMLNVLGRLSGIATLTRQFVDATGHFRARIYDTRKTMPGWRRLEKYAVRMGGGCNHRLGLHSAVLIKDNHLAFRAGAADPNAVWSPAEALAQAQRFVDRLVPANERAKFLVEIEVDSLAQLEAVLPLGPDIVLLDNMQPDEMRQAVARRNAVAPTVELEASGGVDLAHVAVVAATGVDRISVGALTHSAEWFDVGLDWLDRS